MLILYKNDRNVRYVLFTKTSSVWVIRTNGPPMAKHSFIVKAIASFDQLDDFSVTIIVRYLTYLFSAFHFNVHFYILFISMMILEDVKHPLTSEHRKGRPITANNPISEEIK